MKVKNMYRLLDGLCHRNESITINGEQISVTIMSFLRNDLRPYRKHDIYINSLRNELEIIYNNTSMKYSLLEKKLLEFLLKI